MAETQERLDTVGTERAPVGWAFYFQWVLATTAGSLLGLVVAVAALFVPVVALALFSNFDALPLWIVLFVSASSAVGGAGMGITIGIAQRLVLRRHDLRAERWILVTSVGCAVGVLAVTVLSLTLFWSGFWPDLEKVALVLPGALLGFAQWFVLRRRVSRAGWWIPASAVGLYALGTITGGVLVWLLRRHPAPPGGGEA